MGQPGLFLFIFVLIQTQILQKKTVIVSGIWTRIVGVDGEHDDHLTTATAYLKMILVLIWCIYLHSDK